MARILIFCIFLCFGTLQAYADETPSCDTPYDPSNIFEVLLFYQGTMSYLAHGSDSCRYTFAEEVKKVVRESWLVTDGCAEATLKDLDGALEGTYKGEPIPAPATKLSDPVLE
jgi:hypothetical protein